jgi:glycosyltransferase involved in cell wall biosynthesis
MKIGFFTETFLPQTNGVVTSIESFGEELVKRGHEVHIYCPKTNIGMHKGMIIHSKPSIPFLPYPEFKIGIPVGKVEKLDMVHTHGPFLMGNYGLWVARRQKIPKVSTFHTLLSEYVKYLSPAGFGQGALKKIAWKYCFLHYNRYDRVITPSRVVKEMLEIDRPITVIPTGVDIKLFQPQDREKSREKLGLTAEKTYLCLGRLSFEKNIDVVIKAAKWIVDGDAQIVVVGRGPAMESLQKMVKHMKLGTKVLFPGYVSELDKIKYYSAADAFITASTSETQGIVVLEAMACGCPVIGANSLAIPEFVKNGKNGFLFKPGDARDLANVVTDFKYTKAMARRALETAGRYSVENCTTKLEKFYDETLKSSKKK